MITTIEITVGDTGIWLSGQLNGGGLNDLTGCTVKLSILGVDEDLRFTGRDLMTDESATITDAANRRVRCQLTPAVVKRGRGIVRWTVTLPASSGDVHVPGPRDSQVVLLVNP